jgi:hypothetical protein
MRAQAPVARSSCRSSIYRTDKGCTTRIHRSRDRCRHMPAPEPKASTPPTSSASDWRLLAPGPPTSSDVIAAGTVDGRHLVRGVLLQAARHFPRGLQDNLRSAMQASPASRQDVFWTASRRQMSRASRPAHSQCSAIGQNCRCRLVFEFSYFLYSIFHFLDILLNPYIIFIVNPYIILLPLSVRIFNR